MVLLVIMIVAAEVILSGSWTAFYFRAGLPVFKLRLNHRSFATSLTERLSKRFPPGVAPQLVFHRLSEREIAFRERLSTLTWLRYTPVMHGLIRSVPEEGVTYVIGWINWFVVALIGLVLWESYVSSDSVPWILVLGCVGIALLTYGVQVHRFRRVAAAVAGRTIQ